MPEVITREMVEAEIAARDVVECAGDINYFITRYVYIHDEMAGGWVLFELWEAQRWLTGVWKDFRQVIGLKARQLGITWHFLALFLHLAIYRPNSTLLLFSRTEDEAKELLRRMREMHRRLPGWLQRGDTETGHLTEWRLSNGSVVKAFPTGRGDSYTATAVLLDEFDVLTNREQEDQLRSVKPTTDAGGKLVIISRSDKTKPDSPFKRLYRAARDSGKEIDWKAFFLPWYARPSRDRAWYKRIAADCVARTGSMDECHEQYPATDAEALAEKQLDKRLPSEWLDGCYQAAEAVTVSEDVALAGLPEEAPLGRWGAPPVKGLKIFSPPMEGKKYVIGADPAEGLVNSDDSAAEVLDADTLEEVASLAGKHSPAQFGQALADLARWYNDAWVMPERNNHGHALILWLKEKSPQTWVLSGRDKSAGWQTNSVSKAILYDHAAEVFREGACVLHDFETRLQLGSVECDTLSAPDGRHDDRAVAFVLAIAGAEAIPRGKLKVWT